MPSSSIASCPATAPSRRAGSRHRTRLIGRLLALALCLFLAGRVCADDLAVTAVASLINPAKLVTLHGERAANQRVLKCVYWLNDARSRGLKPEEVIVAAQALNQSTMQPRALLVEAALLRNLDIAGKLGCLTSENLDRLRHGRSPVISRGPYAGERAEVDHIVPFAVEPGLDREIANLELLPRTLNRRKGATMGARQLDYLEKFRRAALLKPAPNDSSPNEPASASAPGLKAKD